MNTVPINSTTDSAADEIMCACSGTTRIQIQKLFKQGMDLDAIARWTGALSGCGGCEWDVAQFLNTLSAEQDPHLQDSSP